MLRIAITGPESSGKTTLAKALSEHYNISFVPEFARTYLEKTEGKYKQSDLDIIAQGQLKSLVSSKDDIVICDTDFSVLEIWSQYKYKNTSELIKKLVLKELFDLHILCSPDIPWEEDSLRENQNSREELFELYKESLNRYNKNFIVVNGSAKNRLEKSLQAIDIHKKL
jgi:NadR type nicotinamide-nucleotide adenylyltransferase